MYKTLICLSASMYCLVMMYLISDTNTLALDQQSGRVLFIVHFIALAFIVVFWLVKTEIKAGPLEVDERIN